ncbi:MAG: DNA repair exonuclease [Streptococcaceae bacterium]|jgi:DNA repair exonuclease SbcCD nuclease subunit|nr:DNA repair exonuclease [Streptococcaceae bacterium]
MLTFIHVSDLHIDRSFQAPDEAFETLRDINGFVLENIIDNAIEKQVNFVIFAGDTFHQARTSIQTQAHFIDQVKRLEEYGIPVILSFGNHDYYDKNRYWFEFPSNVYLFESESVDTIRLDFEHSGEKVAISGFSYTHPIITESKLPDFPERDLASTYHIGVYHGENAPKGRFAPFSLSDMKEKGYDYWALGHIHVPMTLSDEMSYIAYPGTPQGHNKKENQVAGILHVTLEDNRVKKVYPIPVAQVLYHHLTIDLRESENLVQAQKAITDVLAAQTIYTLSLDQTHNLDDEFVYSVQSGELLDFLNEKFWVDSVQIIDREKESKFNLFIDEELVLNLVKEEDMKAVRNEMRANMPSELFELFDEDFSAELQESIYKEIKQEYELTGVQYEN